MVKKNQSLTDYVQKISENGCLIVGEYDGVYWLVNAEGKKIRVVGTKRMGIRATKQYIKEIFDTL